MSDSLPFSAASERNRGPILEVLQRHFADRREVLEIGSGSGQHAVHFASALPQLQWQTSDLEENHPGIRARLAAAALPNLRPPLPLDVRSGPWPARRYDALFSANTLHIMAWDAVQSLFARMPALLDADAVVVVYGPFKRDGRHTSDSNAAFDAALRSGDPVRGIRDIEAVHALAARAGLQPLDEVQMPANNLCLVWRSTPRAAHAGVALPGL